VDVDWLLLRHVKRSTSPVLSQRLAEYRSVSVTQYLVIFLLLSFGFIIFLMHCYTELRYESIKFIQVLLL
jgi:hypothetical protein